VEGKSGGSILLSMDHLDKKTVRNPWYCSNKTKFSKSSRLLALQGGGKHTEIGGIYTTEISGG